MRRLECIVTSVSSYLDELKKLPSVLLDRILLMAAISIGVLSIGYFIGIYLKEMSLILWSVALGVLIFCRAVSILQMILKNGYDTVEGKVMKIQGHYLPTRICTVTLIREDGKDAKVLLDKRLKIHMGKTYRFYFGNKSHSLSGIRQVDAMLGTGSFLGYEVIEGWDS